MIVKKDTNGDVNGVVRVDSQQANHTIISDVLTAGPTRQNIRPVGLK
jgi:hypothetical protein